MTTQTQIARSVILPALLVIAANIGGALLVVPIAVQLLINSCGLVYIGCISSTKLAKNQKGEITNYSKNLNEDESVINMSQAKQFPLYASCFLFGFYCLYKVLPKEFFTGLISFYFSFTTVLSVSAIFAENLPFSEKQLKVIYSINLHKWIQNLLEMKKFDISIARIICLVITAIPVGFYFLTRHWAMNNIFAMLFTIMALKSLSLSSTQTGLFLLWALFFYDIFWVYGTDVMVTVAKNLDIPVKLLFPYLNSEGEVKHSMVGLGDLVIPGIFVSLCLKYDLDNFYAKNKMVKSLSQLQLPYFTLCFVGYFYGIVETFLAMFIFQHPQPALLFLVPMCTIPVLLKALFNGQLQHFFNYDTNLKTKQQQKQIEKPKDQ